MTDQSSVASESELAALLNDYHQRYPKAESPASYMMGFGPEQLCAILRNADGREIVFSHPGLDQGVLNGCAYRYNDTLQAGTSGNPITLQELLYARGLPRQDKMVKLVRHRDASGGLDLHDLYRNHRPAFLDYQRQQGNPVFDKCEFVVACLGESGRRSRFVGVFQVLGIERRTEEHLYYNLVEVPGFDDLKERVIFDWGRAALSWHQWLRPETGRTVLEIQAKPFSQPFTDYLDFTLSFAELAQLVSSQSPRDEWCRMLSATAGVYLILDQSSGKQYIGSASGTEGIWGRWKDYVATRGHGGNAELIKLLAVDAQHGRHFQFTVLMTLPKTMTRPEVIKREYLFMKKLGSRAHGLNQKPINE
ncbi:GIY-YIG nuclease family protein [Hymenobacter sp. BT186]|uniref:GIY-YIG nuclease family protein n=1 Tax=Hymenobacter telluris TaxID=2816474 RepID=A0A939F155_9BACT|nr:GIY-YIG nuclease family protein [Hymenobacter telluris]MBO0360876.1 GIY-YIG nuclease family protein [Hymenobacter telluris]MBW3376905.1 GIY-YIG nuclease family protein [Hymenobacter norwichensis]